MVKTKKEKNIVKEDIYINEFELVVDTVNGFIFVDCPDDPEEILFLKKESVYRIFTAA